MARILSRPMFRKGGSANNGIMDGLVDRKGYATAGLIDKEAVSSNVSDIRDLLTEFSPQPRDTSMYEMLIGGGLNLVSGKGAGEGLMANIAGSYKGPSEKFFERQETRRDYDRQIGSAAAKMGLERALRDPSSKASSDWKEAQEIVNLGLINPSTQKPYTMEEAYESARYSQADISRASKAERIDQASAQLTSAGYESGTKAFNERLFYRTEVIDQLLQMPGVTTLDLGGILPRSAKGNKGPKYNKMDPEKYYFDPKTRSVIMYKGIDETLTPGDPGYYKLDTVLEF